ncbi:MAG: MFS transporter [bacterium]
MKELSSREIRRGLKISVVEGAFAILHTTLAGGMFLAGLALYLGANSFQIALLTGIPALATVFSFFSGYLVRATRSRKVLVLWTAGFGRLIFLVLVPLLFLNVKPGVMFLLTVVALSSILMQIAGTVWTSWMSDLVPEEQRGSFFGLRNALLGVIGVFVGYGAGRGMDYLKGGGNEGIGYGLAFGLAALFGFISTLLLTGQPEPKFMSQKQLGVKEVFFGPLQEPQFRRLSIFLAIWFLTGTLASPFYLVHLIKNLQFSFASIAIYSMIGGVIGALFQLLWGRVIDRFGSRPVTVLNFAAVGVMPFLWLFATPGFRLPIWIDGVLNGVVWTGASLGLWNLLLDLAGKPVWKESYFAIYTAITGLGAFLASLVAGGLAQLLSKFHLDFLGLQFYNYDVMFFLAGVARFSCLPLLLKVQESGSKPVRYTVRVISTFAVWRLSAGKDVLFQALGIKPGRSVK